MRIPTEAGWGYRFDVGRRSEMKSVTLRTEAGHRSDQYLPALRGAGGFLGQQLWA